MAERAHVAAVDLKLFAFPRRKAVLHEVPERTAREGFQPRCAQPRETVKRTHRILRKRRGLSRRAQRVQNAPRGQRRLRLVQQADRRVAHIRRQLAFDLRRAQRLSQRVHRRAARIPCVGKPLPVAFRERREKPLHQFQPGRRALRRAVRAGKREADEQFLRRRGEHIEEVHLPQTGKRVAAQAEDVVPRGLRGAFRFVVGKKPAFGRAQNAVLHAHQQQRAHVRAKLYMSQLAAMHRAGPRGQRAQLRGGKPGFQHARRFLHRQPLSVEQREKLIERVHRQPPGQRAVRRLLVHRAFRKRSFPRFERFVNARVFKPAVYGAHGFLRRPRVAQASAQPRKRGQQRLPGGFGPFVLAGLFPGRAAQTLRARIVFQHVCVLARNARQAGLQQIEHILRAIPLARACRRRQQRARQRMRKRGALAVDMIRDFSALQRAFQRPGARSFVAENDGYRIQRHARKRQLPQRFGDARRLVARIGRRGEGDAFLHLARVRLRVQREERPREVSNRLRAARLVPDDFAFPLHFFAVEVSGEAVERLSCRLEDRAVRRGFIVPRKREAHALRLAGHLRRQPHQLRGDQIEAVEPRLRAARKAALRNARAKRFAHVLRVDKPAGKLLFIRLEQRRHVAQLFRKRFILRAHRFRRFAHGGGGHPTLLERGDGRRRLLAEAAPSGGGLIIAKLRPGRRQRALQRHRASRCAKRRFLRRAGARENLPRQALRRHYLHAQQAGQAQPVHQVQLGLQGVLRGGDQQNIFRTGLERRFDFPRDARPERAAAATEHGQHRSSSESKIASIIAACKRRCKPV